MGRARASSVSNDRLGFMYRVLTHSSRYVRRLVVEMVLLALGCFCVLNLFLHTSAIVAVTALPVSITLVLLYEKFG